MSYGRDMLAGAGVGILIFIGILLFVGLIVVGPLLTIWALNTIFGLSIAFTFKTWFATAILHSIFSSAPVTNAIRSLKNNG